MLLEPLLRLPLKDTPGPLFLLPFFYALVTAVQANALGWSLCSRMIWASFCMALSASNPSVCADHCCVSDHLGLESLLLHLLQKDARPSQPLPHSLQ